MTIQTNTFVIRKDGKFFATHSVQFVVGGIVNYIISEDIVLSSWEELGYTWELESVYATDI